MSTSQAPQEQRPSIPSALEAQAYYKLRVSFPPIREGTRLALETVVELLQKAYRAYPPAATTPDYEPVWVDRPSDGSVFMYKMVSGQESDGYGWLDDELCVRQIAPTGIEVHLYTQSQGFAFGEKYASIERVRYIMPSLPQLCLVHYFRSLDANGRPIQRTLVQPHLIRKLPRKPFASPAMITLGGEKNVAPPQQRPLAGLGGKKRSTFGPSPSKLNPTVRTERVAEENMAEELSLPASRVAGNRYKRNLEFMESIFDVSDESSVDGNVQLTEAELKQQIELLDSEIIKNREDIETLKNNKTLEEVKNNSTLYWSALQTLQMCDSVEDVEAHQKSMEKSLGVHFIHSTYPSVHKVQ